MSTSLQTVAAQPNGAALEVLEGKPAQIIERATEIANALMAVEKRQPGLVAMIQGRKYLRAEMWTTMGAMLKVFPRVAWSRQIEGETEAWEARVDLVHLLTGDVVGGAEAMASAAERAPWGRASYSIRSMAQTRATGKAFRLGFSWIPVLAGYEATPAEEMPPDADYGSAPATRTAPPKKDERDAARRYLWAVFHALEEQKAAKFTTPLGDGSVLFQLTGKDQAGYRASFCSTLLGKEIKDIKDMSAEDMREAGRRALELNGIALPDRKAA